MKPSRDFQFVKPDGSSIRFAVWNHLRNKRQLEILIKVIVLIRLKYVQLLI